MVTDSTTGDPLPGANLILRGTSIGAASDINGECRILGVPPGTYSLDASFIGYKPVTVPIRVTPGQTLKQDVKMQFMLVDLDGQVVVITAQRQGQLKAINRQLTADAILNAVSAERIQEVPDANVAESVGRLPGVSISRSGGEGQSVIIRGLSPKYNAITINGERIPSTSRNTRATDLSMISFCSTVYLNCARLGLGLTNL